MPWVDGEMCDGCGLCVEECPVGAIVMEDDEAEIHMEECIRCGVCHGVCPTDAIRHDSEKIPLEVEANVARAKESMEACAEHLGDEREKQRCLTRMMKHFNKEKTVAEKTLERLRGLRED